MKSLHRTTTCLLPAFLLFATAIPGVAAAASIAAETAVSTVSPCPSFCGGSGSISEFDSDGGEGFASSQSSIPAGVNGSGAALAQLSGGALALPVLGAEAFSEADSNVNSNAAAMHKYTYNGATSLFTLDLVLEGSLGEGSQPPDADLFVNTIIATASDLDFFRDYGSFRFEILPGTPDASVLVESEIDFRDLDLVDLGFQRVTDSIDFTLEDGDMVFIWSSLVASGTRGGFADGLNTFGMSFSAGNVAGLTASTSPVPLPAPIALLASALGVIALRRRTARA